MDQRQVEVLQQTLGLDRYGRGSLYRNYLVPYGADVDVCRSLAAMGYMCEQRPNPRLGLSSVYWATQEGIAAVLRESPAPPRLSRNKRRYQHYLDVADSFMTFREYLRAGLWKEA